MFGSLDSISFKPTNPSSKDLDDVIQAAHEYIEDAINHINHQMDGRFHAASQNLEQKLRNIRTIMDYWQQLDSIQEYVMSLPTKIMAQSGVQQFTTILHSNILFRYTYLLIIFPIFLVIDMLLHLLFHLL